MRGTPITCPHCSGTGHTVLSSVYEFTLKALRRAGTATGAQLARALEVKATAVNNRLRALERHGLAVAIERDGREVYYEAFNGERLPAKTLEAVANELTATGFSPVLQKYPTGWHCSLENNLLGFYPGGWGETAIKAIEAASGHPLVVKAQEDAT